MPFYEYQCKNCGHALEAMQKISDSPLKKCPHCGKSQLQRLMSAPVFRLKGAGWYETDFKGDGDNKRNLADKPEAEVPKDTAISDVKAKDGKDAKLSETKAADPPPSDATKSKDKPAAITPASAGNAKAASGKNSSQGRLKRLPKKSAVKAKKGR